MYKNSDRIKCVFQLADLFRSSSWFWSCSSWSWRRAGCCRRWGCSIISSRRWCSAIATTGGLTSSVPAYIGRLGIGGWGQQGLGGCFPLCCNLSIQGIQPLGLRAVKIKPPVTNEILLVENCSIGTEERVFGETSLAITCANVKDLTLGIRVTVISPIHLIKHFHYLVDKRDQSETVLNYLPVARERCFRYFG